MARAIPYSVSELIRSGTSILDIQVNRWMLTSVINYSFIGNEITTSDPDNWIQPDFGYPSQVLKGDLIVVWVTNYGSPSDTAAQQTSMTWRLIGPNAEDYETASYSFPSVFKHVQFWWKRARYDGEWPGGVWFESYSGGGNPSSSSVRQSVHQRVFRDLDPNYLFVPIGTDLVDRVTITEEMIGPVNSIYEHGYGFVEAYYGGVGSPITNYVDPNGENEVWDHYEVLRPSATSGWKTNVVRTKASFLNSYPDYYQTAPSVSLDPYPRFSSYSFYNPNYDDNGYIIGEVFPASYWWGFMLYMQGRRIGPRGWKIGHI